MEIAALMYLLMRFIHILSFATLVGGAIYARVATLPALNALPDADRSGAASTAQLRFRNLLIVLVVLVAISGLYIGFGPGAPLHTRTWHIWFGIKVLVALHFLSAAVLWASSPYGDVQVGGKSKSRLVGLIISGIVLIFIGNYLRFQSLGG